jgi:hypothetical protein
MRKNIVSVLFIAFAILACSKSITLGIINRSGVPVSINQPTKLDCGPNEIAFFTPERKKHDIEISTQAGSFSYDLLGMPPSYLDIQNKKRLLFVFGEDHKLYLLKPTNNPLAEKIGDQPPGYPLVPAKN